MKLTLHDYQAEALELMRANPVFALFMDPGCGKTIVTLSALKKFRPLKTLLVAPLEIVYRVWPNEIKKWDDVNDLTCAIMHGPTKESAFMEDADIYIINPEGLKWLKQHVQRTRRWPFSILVIDESTTFKNHKSQRFSSYLEPMLSKFRRRYILSGTPVTKTYLDLWSQYFILDRGTRLGDSYYGYKSRYFYQADRSGFKWELFPGFEDKIKDLVKDITIHVNANDHLDLPDIVFNDVVVDLTASAKKAYKELAKDLLTNLDNDITITAANAAVKTGKLQCVSNGFLYTTAIDPKTGKNVITGAVNLHKQKVEALASIIEELNGNPILVGFHYKQDLQLLLEKFPGTPYFGSGVTNERKQQIENEWNAGKIPILFAQIHSTARGLNLQESGYHIAFFSLTYNWEDANQLVKRIARQGQKASRVFVHRLIARNTVDELIISTLDHRETQSVDFLVALKRNLKLGLES